MRYSLLQPKCRLNNRAVYIARKCFTPKKTLGNLSKSKALKEFVKNSSKVQESSMSGKSLTKFVISPLLTENEKKYVRYGKSSLGYSLNEPYSIETVVDDCLESSDSSSSSDDDDEYVFFENQFPIANNC